MLFRNSKDEGEAWLSDINSLMKRFGTFSLKKRHHSGNEEGDHFPTFASKRFWDNTEFAWKKRWDNSNFAWKKR